jgi:hypothetical protein
MAELKTETIVVNATNKVRFSNPLPTINLTKHQAATIQLEPEIATHKTIKQH